MSRLKEAEELSAIAASQGRGKLALQYALKSKKSEKVRVIRENELLEALFSFRNVKTGQKKEFESLSYQIMRKIDPGFSCTLQQNGVYSDLTQLFERFFVSQNQTQKLSELRLISDNNLYSNFPFISMLNKWLVEISRQHYAALTTQIQKNHTKCSPSLYTEGQFLEAMSQAQKQLQVLGKSPAEAGTIPDPIPSLVATPTKPTKAGDKGRPTPLLLKSVEIKQFKLQTEPKAVNRRELCQRSFDAGRIPGDMSSLLNQQRLSVGQCTDLQQIIQYSD